MNRLIKILLSFSLIIALSPAHANGKNKNSKSNTKTPAYSSLSESKDDADVVRAAEFWTNNVEGFFGKRGLARIEVLEIPILKKGGKLIHSFDYFSVDCYYGGYYEDDYYEDDYYEDDYYEDDFCWPDTVFYSAWGIDHDGNVWGWDNYTWNYLSSKGLDIGVGGGEAFLIKKNKTMWIWNGYKFKRASDKGTGYTRVDVLEDGSPVVIDVNGAAWEYFDGEWYFLRRNAENIHVDLDVNSYQLFITGKEGNVWVYRFKAEKWKKVNWARRSLATRRIERR